MTFYIYFGSYLYTYSLRDIMICNMHYVATFKGFLKTYCDNHLDAWSDLYEIHAVS